MLEKIGGRKLLVSLVVGGTGTIIALSRGDLPPNLLQLFELILAAFVGGNLVAQALDRGPKIKLPKAINEEESNDQDLFDVPPPDLQSPPPEAPPSIQPTLAPGVPNEMVVAAFNELGALINGHAARQQESLDGIMKATQVNQQALSVVVDKVMAINAKLPQQF